MAPATEARPVVQLQERLNESKLEEVVPTDYCKNITEACLECIFLLCEGREQSAVSKGRSG